MKKTTVFDKKEHFEEVCRPLLNELVYHCRMENIPFFFGACVKSEEECTEYINDGVMTGSKGIYLFDDQIAKHMLIAAGFDAKPHEEDLVIPDDFGPTED